jgi:ubiquinone/menaquinone biosynthesis C-methylase UbiE
VTPLLRKLIFETLYKNRYLYRFASTIPFAGQWRVWQRLVIARIRGLEVLEIGCGLGDLLADMLQAGYHCRAVERSPQMVAAARDTLRKRRVGDASLVIQGSAQALPIPSATIDTVVSTFPSEYIYDPDTIAEIARVLRPGGRLIVIEGGELLPVGFIQPFLLLIHALIYGPRVLLEPARQRKQRQKSTTNNTTTKQSSQQSGVITEVVSNTPFGSFMPLERFGLARRSECVRNPRWKAYIIIGDKMP